MDVQPDEVFIIGEVLAETQELATAVADTARVATIVSLQLKSTECRLTCPSSKHGPYPGQKATSGNFAFGIVGSKSIEMGPCPEFCLYHLMELQPGEEVASRFQLTPDADTIAVSAMESTTNTPLFRWRTQQVGRGMERAERKLQQLELTTSHEPGKSRGGALVKPRDETTQNLRWLPVHATLADVANVLRSKNSGPFEITFDVMFESEEVYRIIKECRILSSKLVEDLFELKPEEVFWCGWFDQARAWKATIPRKRHGSAMPGGGFMENDIHGSQQYIPLLNVPVPKEVLARLGKPDEGSHHVNL